MQFQNIERILCAITDVGSRRYIIMDHHIPAWPRSKFWFICFALFLFWYLLLYGFDWTSLPRSSSVSRSQENSLQSNSIPKSDDDNNQEINSLRSKDVSHDKNQESSRVEGSNSLLRSDKVPVGKNVAMVSNANVVLDHKGQEEGNASDGFWSTEKLDEFGDLASLEKELEALLPKEEEEDQDIAPNPKILRKPCTNRYVYIHNIPSRFNYNYLKQCKLMNKWDDMCQYLENEGLGRDLGNPQRLLMRSGWYVTHQFSLDVIFHGLMKRYECLTNESSKASAIYVPYYAGLDVSRYLWDHYSSSIKDADALALFNWLRATPEWKVMGGRDHFLVAGRITWDFRRAVDDGSGWGSKLMLLPESQNMTMITIESSPWDGNDFAIPYPTYFHPSSDDQVSTWQNTMRKKKRRTLFCFAGAPRPNMESSIRGEIMQQCGAAASRRRCKMMKCKDEKHNCLKPANVMRMFQSSSFCLQPPGDSFTRRSTFDSILAGCIPVFFSPASAYAQYLWHLPKDFGSYSVLIPETDVKQKNVSIERVLSQIQKPQVSAMREKVIKLIPNVVYSDPRSRLKKHDDAFDLAIQGVIGRIDGLKKEMREGRNRSAEFGTTRENEWDH